MSADPVDKGFDNQPLGDFFADDNPYDRPERTEDRVPRDTWGKPRILPVDKKMPQDPAKRDKVLRSYFRPSGWAEVLEDHYKLERWNERRTVEGMMADKGLRAEWITAGVEEDEDGVKNRVVADLRDDIIKRAKARAGTGVKSSVGTALHAVTERHDLGLANVNLPEEYQVDLDEWIRLTAPLKILAVECFVVEDYYKLAGTFDRLAYYHEPCSNCGHRVRVVDLKSGHGDKVSYEGMKIGTQLAVYAHSQFYDPATGARTPIEDICLCRAIVVDLPAGSGRGVLRWVNIGQAWTEAVSLAATVREIRKKKNWWLEFVPTLDIMPLIASATSTQELNGIWSTYRSIWTPEHTIAGNSRLEELGKK